MSLEEAGIAATADAAGTHNDQPLLRPRSVGSDWEGILALHLQILARSGLMQAYEVCECTPCRSPGFCRACREADQRKARSEQPRHIDQCAGIASVADAGLRASRWSCCDVRWTLSSHADCCNPRNGRIVPP